MRLHYEGDYVEAAWGDIQGIVQMVKFNRESVKALLNDARGYVELKVTVFVAGTMFEGIDTIRVKIE